MKKKIIGIIILISLVTSIFTGVLSKSVVGSNLENEEINGNIAINNNPPAPDLVGEIFCELVVDDPNIFGLYYYHYKVFVYNDGTEPLDMDEDFKDKIAVKLSYKDRITGKIDLTREFYWCDSYDNSFDKLEINRGNSYSTSDFLSPYRKLSKYILVVEVDPTSPDEPFGFIYEGDQGEDNGNYFEYEPPLLPKSESLSIPFLQRILRLRNSLLEIIFNLIVL